MTATWASARLPSTLASSSSAVSSSACRVLTTSRFVRSLSRAFCAFFTRSAGASTAALPTARPASSTAARCPSASITTLAKASSIFCALAAASITLPAEISATLVASSHTFASCCRFSCAAVRVRFAFSKRCCAKASVRLSCAASARRSLSTSSAFARFSLSCSTLARACFNSLATLSESASAARRASCMRCNFSSAAPSRCFASATCASQASSRSSA
mmetsp:Transcript_52357/g.121737  ORF Transcript_52357/g.121737 Transcript_52357/m.121737 type:complete len:218 (+) Transcript_52357:887-1540(+)